MESLSTPCIFCGEDRPIASDTCPACGRGWIDQRVAASEPEAAQIPEPDAPAAVDAGESEPVEDERGADVGEHEHDTMEPPIAADDPTEAMTGDQDAPETEADEAQAPPIPDAETGADTIDIPDIVAAAPAAAATGLADTPAEGSPEARQAGEEIDDILDEAGIPDAAPPASSTGLPPATGGVSTGVPPMPPIDEPDPRTASDDMIDDAAAWSAFAAGVGDAAIEEPGPGAADEDTASAENGRPEVAAGGAVAGATAAVSSGTFQGEHPDGSDFFSEEPPETARRSRLTQSIIVAMIVVGIIAAWFVVIALITRGDNEVAAPADTTTAATETTSATSEAPTTTSAPTTTTSATTTTTTTTAPPPVEAVGDPIPIADLSMAASALGILDFGDDDALGRLVATFDQPDERGPADTGLGLCEGDTGFFATWGPLTAVFTGVEENSLFEGYFMGLDPAHPAGGIETLSGLQVGDAVEDLESIYSGFTIVYEDIDGSPHFILEGASGSTLLWGPVTSTDPTTGVVDGINAPLACDGGPTPSS